MSESTDLHRQMKITLDINVIWSGFKTLLVHINMGLAFAPLALPTSRSFKSERKDVKI